jgi:hypothetical protein
MRLKDQVQTLSVLDKIRYKRILDGVSKKYPTSKEKRQEWIKRNKEHLKNYRRKRRCFKKCNCFGKSELETISFRSCCKFIF